MLVDHQNIFFSGNVIIYFSMIFNITLTLKTFYLLISYSVVLGYWLVRFFLNINFSAKK